MYQKKHLRSTTFFATFTFKKMELLSSHIQGRALLNLDLDFGWAADWLDWLACLLAEWLADWLVEWLACWLDWRAD